MKAFRARLWRIKLTEAVLAGVIGFILSFLTLFISDRFWTTPPAVSLGILIAGTLLAGLFAPYWIHRWVWKKRRANQIARLLSEQYPQLGDRILGIVELGTPEKSHALYSEALKKAAVIQVADDASQVDFSLAVPRPRHKLAITLAVALVLMLGVLAYLVPEATLNTFQRWIRPTGDVPRYTFTRLIDVPGRIYVPIGETFHLDITVDPASRRLVETASARANGSLVLTEPLVRDDSGNLRASFAFPGIFETATIRIDAGDAHYDVEAVPCMRPNIADLSATLSYPDYIGRPPEKLSLKTGSLYGLTDSRVELEAKSTNELETAYLLPENAEDDSTPTGYASLKVEGGTVSFPSLTLNASRELRFIWTDIHGITAQSPFRVRMEAVEDSPPDIYLQNTKTELYLLERESCELELLGADDYGMMELGVEWHGEDINTKRILQQGDRQTRQLTTKFIFQADALGLQPQKITLYAIGRDHKPDREYRRSSPITIFILTKNEHAQKIRADLEALGNIVEEIAQRQQMLADESERLKKLDETGLIDPENRALLKELAQNERENAEKLKQVIEEMDELFKKALRNDEIDNDAMRPFLEAKGILENIPENSQKKAQEALDRAAEDNNTPEKTTEELENANEEQQESLQKLNEALRKMNESTKNLEAGTFVARLKKAATDEREITDIFSAMIKDTIGMIPDELLPKDRREVGKSSLLQKSIIRDMYWIADDLNHFYIRSNDEIHKKIAEELTELLMDSELEAIPDIISMNHGASTIEKTAKVAELLLNWANMIAKTKSDSGGGGGGGMGGSEGGMSESDFDFMLKVMRMIQAQQDIRARTRSLEEEKAPRSPGAATLPESPHAHETEHSTTKDNSE